MLPTMAIARKQAPRFVHLRSRDCATPAPVPRVPQRIASQAMSIANKPLADPMISCWRDRARPVQFISMSSNTLLMKNIGEWYKKYKHHVTLQLTRVYYSTLWLLAYRVNAGT
jgi:hypothetical protein